MGRKTPTLAEIARRAGVSVDTVSRILGGRLKGAYPRVMKRAERVLEIARSMGYRANTSARAVRTGRFNAAGLIFGDTRTALHLPSELVASMSRGLAGHGWHLVATELSKKRLDDGGDMPKVLGELAVDGLILNAFVDMPDQTLELMKRHDMPMLWVNDKRDADCVYPDDRAAARSATKRLLELGHRRIAYLHFDTGWHYSGRERKAGYMSAMKAAGLEPRCEHAEYHPAYLGGDPTGQERLQFVRSLLTGKRRPTAIVCYEAREATAVAMAAGTLGLDVPRQLSIVGHSERPIKWPGIDITTMWVPFWEVGARAADLIVEKVDHSRKKMKPVPVAYREPVGVTCVAPGNE